MRRFDEKLFVINLVIFTASRTVPNDHLWLISPNWIKSASLQRTLVLLQLICECHPLSCKDLSQGRFLSIFCRVISLIVAHKEPALETKEGEISNYPPFPPFREWLPGPLEFEIRVILHPAQNAFKREQIVFKVITICFNFNISNCTQLVWLTYT